MSEPFKWVKRHIEMLSYKWPPRNQAKENARRPSQLKDKRIRWEYQCNHCKKWFKGNQIQIDHIIPKGRYDKDTFFVWLERLFCDTNGFQILCRPCHVKKSAQEHKDDSYK